MKNIHIVAHTHWDREWYFTTQDSLILSDQIFTNVIKTLEKDVKAEFCMDGQTSIVEEYIAIRPDMKERLIKLIKEERITIGPWYTQTDCLYVDGESIIRNLAYGVKQAKEYGSVMKIAYLPDSFGFNVQMPTLIKGCGIDSAIIRRGFDIENTNDSYFKWVGLGNKKINTVHLLEGYGVAYGLNTEESFRNQRLFPYVEEMDNFTSCSDILVCSGGDQVDIINNLDDKINEISSYSTNNYFQSSYNKFFKATELYYKTEYTGELRTGKYDRVHRTIGSVRYDIKKLNNDVEKKLLYTVEPLMAIGKSFGVEIGTELLYKAWKLLMEGQAHDGMGGCITDVVAKQVIDRFLLAKEIADGIENLVKKRISERIGVGPNNVIIFNTDIKEFSGYKIIEFMSNNQDIKIKECEEFEIKDTQYFEGKKDLLVENPEGHVYVNEDPYYKITALVKCNLPALGFKVFNIVEDKNKTAKSIETNISNEFYTISVNNGISVEFKDTGKVIDNFIYLEDCGNDGDTYDFSPLLDDKPVTFKFNKCKTIVGKSYQKIIASVVFELPLTLEDRINDNNRVLNSAKLEIELLRGSKLMNCNLIVDNKALSHRLRLAIKSDINTTQSIASVPCGFITRNIDEVKKHTCEENYCESMIDIEVLDELVALSNGNTLSVVTKGIKEYQVEEDILYLTLFSSTGELGKPNLIYRPGRASGDTTKKGHVMIPTPSAQLLGEVDFNFAIEFKDSEFDELAGQKLITKYNQPSIYYQAQVINKFINRLDNKIQPLQENNMIDIRKFSLLQINNDDVELSSISPSLYDDKYILRIKNATSNTIDLNSLGIVDYQVVNAIEEEQVTSVIEKYDFVSLKISL